MRSDNINMNEEQIEVIATKVLDKLIQWGNGPEWHQMNSPLTIKDIMRGLMPFKETDEEFLVGQLARLTTLLHMYEDNQEFMKAAIIKRKLEIIQKRYKKFVDIGSYPFFRLGKIGVSVVSRSTSKINLVKVHNDLIKVIKNKKIKILNI